MSRNARRWLDTQALDPGGLANMELRLNAASLIGSPGDKITSWADTSGKGRTATQGTVNNQPSICTNTAFDPQSPSGQVGAAFDVSKPQFLAGAWPGAGLVTARGMTFYAWVWQGSFGGANQVLWQDSSGSRPQLLEADGTSKTGWRDDGGTWGLATKTDGYHSLVWVFAPPDDGSGVCTVYQDGVSIGSHVWSFTGGVGSGYFLCANQVGNAGYAGLVYEMMAFSAAHDAFTRNGVLAAGAAKWGI